MCLLQSYAWRSLALQERQLQNQFQTEQLRLLTTEAEARCVPRLHVTHKQERHESKLLHAGASTLPGALRHSSGANIHQPGEGPNGLKIFVFLKGASQIADRVGECSASGEVARE